MISNLKLNQTLVDCVIQSTLEGLAMTGVEPDAVGVSRFTTVPRKLSVLLGLHGERNGNMTFNLSEHTAAFLAARLLGLDEPAQELDEDVIDGICEIGNVIAGQMKNTLSDTRYAFDTISLPALVIGASYNVYHLKNITTVSVTFEINEISVTRVNDKFFTTSIAVMEK